ncbi:HAMP domain-containing protein [Pelotomaculum terephthalicicum JT]|uniref:adenylate/guanylate cyclase domain-containing protein n=1 Tax=Pelotomaculum terephthalicicum TaxID=206393 RepID=UPI001F0444A4|nr:adenylate/guanylate cyclase domain-containing protein [Pelotomaculum terephthalicicum]MCG9968459.1 HAMP domain-containing protein [Pelotomaculum terephthalicicum JT]
MKRLVKTNPSGVLTSIIDSDNGKKDSSVLFADVVADNSGSFYVLSTVLDAQGYYVESEEINRYTPAGNFDKQLYRVEYDRENRPNRTGRLKTLDIKDNFLYFYSVGQDKIILNRLTLNGDNVDSLFSIFLDGEMFLSEIAGLEFGSIFFTTKKGEIYQINDSGRPVLVYSSGSGEKSLPVYLDVGADKHIYFADVYREEIDRLRTGEINSAETLLSERKLYEQGYSVPFSVLKDLSIKQDGSVLIAASDRVICVRPDGGINFILEKVKFPYKTMAMRLLAWLLVLLAVVLFLRGCRILYVDIMQKKISLIFKQLCFIPVIVLAMVLVSSVINASYSQKYEAEIYSKLKLLAHIGIQMIDSERLSKITTPGHFLNSDYKEIKEKINLIYDDNSSENEEGFYFVVYKLEEEKLYWCITDDDNMSPFYPFNIQNNDYYKVIRDGQFITGHESDAEGEWMYAVGPLMNPEGKVIGAFETGMDLNSFNELKRKLFLTAGKSIAAAAIVIIVLFMLMTYYLLSSIQILRNGVNEMASGNWDATVSVKSRDEVGELCGGFNKMSEYIRKYIADITILNESYLRFVPQQFVHFLGKQSIVDVQLGDQVKEEMSVLFSSVRSFSLLSKTLRPEESFDLINAYLKRVGPIVRNNGGFVDDYTGNGIIALFPGTAGEALRAAVDMRKELERYNEQRLKEGYLSIDTGTGIHRGPLMLGIIGEEKRLEGTVISDNVDLAATIERITEKFGASILITENMLGEAGVREQYQYRLLGLVQVSVKEEPVKIFDLYQGDPEDIKKLKHETKDIFEEGIMLYRDGRFYDARSRFVEVVRENFRDEAAKIYFFLCDEYYKKGAPEGWNGTLPA